MIATRENIEKSIYDFVNKYIEENKVNPSFREISKAVGYKNVSGVFPHIKRICRGSAGIISRRGII